MEVSLILRVLPHYIGCHYYLLFLFSEYWLIHPSTLSFPKGWHSHPFTAFIMWSGSASQLAYLHFRGLAQPPSCCLIFEGLTLLPNCYFILWIGLASQLLTFTVVGKSNQILLVVIFHKSLIIPTGISIKCNIVIHLWCGYNFRSIISNSEMRFKF